MQERGRAAALFAAALFAAVALVACEGRGAEGEELAVEDARGERARPAPREEEPAAEEPAVVEDSVRPSEPGAPAEGTYSVVERDGTPAPEAGPSEAIGDADGDRLARREAGALDDDDTRGVEDAAGGAEADGTEAGPLDEADGFEGEVTYGDTDAFDEEVTFGDTDAFS